MSDEITVASERELQTVLASLAREKQMVFFAGLPGVGKSLFIRELAHAAHASGRRVHLLQWDVARPAFVTPEIAARYSEQAGESHAMIRLAVGEWSRGAVQRWRREHDASHILIGEVPLIGHRLLDLVQIKADEAEPLLAGPDALFAIPVPSIAVRDTIEAARSRTFANPAHVRERADAPPDLMRSAWQELHGHAVALGAARAVGGLAQYDPHAYAAVFRHLLRHRQTLTLWMNTTLASHKSVYDLDISAIELVPQAGEGEAIVARLEKKYSPAEIEYDAASWFKRI